MLRQAAVDFQGQGFPLARLTCSKYNTICYTLCVQVRSLATSEFECAFQIKRCNGFENLSLFSAKYIATTSYILLNLLNFRSQVTF